MKTQKLKIRTNKDSEGNILTYTIIGHPTCEFEFNTYYKCKKFKDDYENLK